MNSIDILSRSLSKPSDPQLLRDPSASNDATDASEAFPGAAGFDTLLKGLSVQSLRDGKNTQAPQGQDALDLAADPNPADAAGTEAGNAVFVLLEGLLPRVLPQPATSAFSGSQSHDASLPLMSPTGQQQQDTNELLRSPVQQRLMVAVQHQETHFKPIIEASVTDADLEGEGHIKDEAGVNSMDKFIAGSPKVVQPRQQNLTRDILPQEVAPRVVKEFGEGQEINKDQFSNVTVERLGARRSMPSIAPQSEDTNLPPTTLQRLASSLGDEIRSMIDEAAQRATPTNQMPHVFSMKASDSALRILNLQLHPADLGRVTIKMRLAGDSLEMEMHTEKEETAQLLRNDSEKLSSLLRASGYRPDAITIQVSVTADQDRISVTRQQSNMEFQGQSFQQGSADQEGHSRNQEKQYASTRTEPPLNQADDHSLGSRNPSAVYL